MKKGDLYRDDQGLLIRVNRVSSSQAWADIRVSAPGGAKWTVRAPLLDGEFAFPAKKVQSYLDLEVAYLELADKRKGSREVSD